MKDSELRPCDLCNGPLPMPGLPFAGVEIRFARLAVDVRASQRLQGMTTFFGGAQAFAGFVALPEQAGGEPWHETLGVGPDASREQIEAAYKRLAFQNHPDKGGDRAEWDRLQDVRKIALRAVDSR